MNVLLRNSAFLSSGTSSFRTKRPSRRSVGTSWLSAVTASCGCLVAAASLASSAASVATDVEDAQQVHWSQWRGAERDGLSAGEPWPADLEELELLWQTELGKGYSGPVMSADVIFVAETVDTQGEGTEGARAFDLETGREIWRTTWTGKGDVPFFAQRNGDWIRSTPAFDGEALYVGGMQEVLHRLDAKTGEIVWSVDFPARFGTGVPDFGFSSSPLVNEGQLYVQAANSIVKLDPETGETIWRALANDGDIMRSGAFSSPVLTELAGRQQLVVQTREVLHGLDPETGKTLWSQPVPSFRGMNILTPIVLGDRLFTSTHRNRSFMYEVRPDGQGGFDVAEVWTHKAQGYMSSPVIYQDRIYLHLGNGRLTVIDAENGSENWTSKPFGDYWSLVRRDAQLLALDSSGELLLLDLEDPVPQLLSRREISPQSTWGHLAAQGDYVVVRELEGLKVLRTAKR